MSKCKNCDDKGLDGGCPKCGKIFYGIVVTEEEIKHVDYVIPAYYKINQWKSEKIVLSPNVGTKTTLGVVDNMVTQVSQGKKLGASYVVLLPYGHGKKTAMFTIIQQYLKNGWSVAPVLDVASLAIMENNFRLNEKAAMEAWRTLINADLVCIYGVDFAARYQTMKLFLNICSIRGLQGKNSLLFAENSLNDLRSTYIADNLIPENNMKDIGCRLSHPYILDGIIARTV